MSDNGNPNSIDLRDWLALRVHAGHLEEAGQDDLAADYRTLAGLVEDYPGLGDALMQTSHVGDLLRDCLDDSDDFSPTRGQMRHDRGLATAQQDHGYFTDSAILLKMTTREHTTLRRRKASPEPPWPVTRTIRALRPSARLSLSGIDVGRSGTCCLALSCRGNDWLLDAKYYGLLRRRHPAGTFHLTGEHGTLAVVEGGEAVAFVMCMV